MSNHCNLEVLDVKSNKENDRASKNANKEVNAYTFDRVYYENSLTTEIFSDNFKPLVDQVRLLI